MTSRRNPFEDLERFFERMSDQFESDWGPGSVAGVAGGSVAVDVEDRGDEFVVTADLPGFEKDDIDVQLRGDALEVTAESESETETEDEGRYVRRERHARSVSRSLTLPGDVDEAGVSASYNNGVLTVTLPKADAGEGGHRIDID